MTGIYSIGYTSNEHHNKFSKIWDENGRTKKYATIEECREEILTSNYKTVYRIMKGWTVIEEIELK